ncbi:hypothetical protein BJ878DRAFT_100567 [Calycina marina]|uniref:Uncharacterized protein n=1 Tax=Calycina marina TaxID=1763456 RepID=A0A9P7Z9H5_9HELO|nr:hypothetical protein BJ878DRAFT_100567 [Calycina marina]
MHLLLAIPSLLSFWMQKPYLAVQIEILESVCVPVYPIPLVRSSSRQENKQERVFSALSFKFNDPNDPEEDSCLLPYFQLHPSQFTTTSQVFDNYTTPCFTRSSQTSSILPQLLVQHFHISTKAQILRPQQLASQRPALPLTYPLTLTTCITILVLVLHLHKTHPRPNISQPHTRHNLLQVFIDFPNPSHDTWFSIPTHLEKRAKDVSNKT